MKTMMNTHLGNISIDSDVIANYAGSVAIECIGVVGMASVNVKDGLVKLLKLNDLSRGVTVHVDNAGLTIDFHLIVAYGVNILAVSDNLISNVNEISAGLNLSTSYFQHIYKQLFGVSVMSDIIRSRIEYACYLLSNNADSISEIAFRCGYENKEHFTRQFKEITGFTPRQYREKI